MKTCSTDMPNKIRLWHKFFGLPAYHWQLIAVGCVLAIHVFFIPIWLSFAAFISIIAQKSSIRSWANKISHHRRKSLYRNIQMVGLVTGLIGIWLSFGQVVLGVNVSICFLVLCLILKLWEMGERRDAYVVLNLNLFVLASAFLWSQSLGMGLSALIGLLATMFGFIALSDDDNQTGEGRLRSLGLLSFPALPLLFVLFLFVPRIPPLWSAPNLGKQATTGVSDSMSPGDFSSLSKSTELAFRVEFDGSIPNRHELYWRAMVFSDFDGVTWRASKNNLEIWQSDNPKIPTWAMPLTDKGQIYKVILEPTFQHWLFGLEHSRLVPMRGLVTTKELTYRTYFPIDQQLQYQAIYQSGYQASEYLDEQARQDNLTLPKFGNAKARAFAQNLLQKSNHNPKDFIHNIHTHINQGNFRYTLSPPALHQDRIDEFLFDTQAGFCEHYTSSFVFLMRAAGIPARVITGYQGGELGRDGKSWEVRQMDAHAWAEVWLDDEGWVRIDPTAFIAPERIDNGMNALTDAAGASMFGDGVVAAFGYQQFRLLQNFRRLSDQASYYWQRNIVSFDRDNQKNSLGQWLNITSLTQQLLYLIGLFLLSLGGFVTIFLYRRRRFYHPFDLPIVKLSKALSKKDKQLAKAQSETVLAYLDRLAQQSDDSLQVDFDKLKASYRYHRYGQQANQSDSPNNKHAQKQFAKTINQLKKQF